MFKVRYTDRFPRCVRTDMREGEFLTVSLLAFFLANVTHRHRVYGGLETFAALLMLIYPVRASSGV